MEAVPGSRQTRMPVKSKFVHSYDKLLSGQDPIDEREDKETFWDAIFLLDVNTQFLASTIDELEKKRLLSLGIKTNIQVIFRQCVMRLNLKDQNESDIKRKIHATETLQVFFRHVLGKGLTNSEIITIFTGLDKADDLWISLVIGIDNALRHENINFQSIGLKLALTIVSRSNQGTLNVYFMQRDLFSSLMKLVEDSKTTHLTFDASLLLGLLLHYNKFEIRNPYSTRVADYVNDQVMQRIISVIGSICIELRNKYSQIGHEDEQSGYISQLLNGVFGSRQAIPNEEILNDLSNFPPNQIVILLTLYEFINRNKAFTVCFVKKELVENLPDLNGSEEKLDTIQTNIEPPLCSFLSLSSYIVQHSNQSLRTTIYARLCLIILLILSEDLSACQYIFNDDIRYMIKIGTLRKPIISTGKEPRSIACGFYDVAICFILHNLSFNSFNGEMYVHTLGIIFRLLSFQKRSHIRVKYSFTELWRSLISLITFINSNIDKLKTVPQIIEIIEEIIQLFNIAVTFGDTFFSDSQSLDEIFYEILRNEKVFDEFGKLIGISITGEKVEESLAKVKLKRLPNIINLRTIYTHFGPKIIQLKESRKGLIMESQVFRIIRDNYDSLELITINIETARSYREMNEKDFMKQLSRIAFKDVL